MKTLQLIFAVCFLFIAGTKSFAQEVDDLYFSAKDRVEVKYADGTENGYSSQDFSNNSYRNDEIARNVDPSLVEYYRNKAEETSNSYVSNNYDNGAYANNSINEPYYDNQNDFVSGGNFNDRPINNFNYYGPSYLNDPWFINPGVSFYNGFGWGANYPWRPAGFGFGWNSWGGWNAGFGWGWNSGFGWGWNNGFLGWNDPFWGYGFGGFGYGGFGWGSNCFGCWNPRIVCGSGFGPGIVIVSDRNISPTVNRPRYSDRSTNTAGSGTIRNSRNNSSGGRMGGTIVGREQANERLASSTKRGSSVDRSNSSSASATQRSSTVSDTRSQSSTRSNTSTSAQDRYRSPSTYQRGGGSPNSTGRSGTPVGSGYEQGSREYNAQQRYSQPARGANSSNTRTSNPNVSRSSGSESYPTYNRTTTPSRSTTQGRSSSPNVNRPPTYRSAPSPSRNSGSYSAPSRNSSPSRGGGSYSAPSRSSSPSRSSGSMRSSSPSRSSSPARSTPSNSSGGGSSRGRR